MIKTISFANYRIFADKQELILAPVTIIFGKNNVGKSAVLKLPLLIRSILSPRSDEELFDKTMNGLRICEDYSDVVYRKGHRATHLEMTDANDHVEIDFYVEAKGKPRTHIEKIEGILNGVNLSDPKQLTLRTPDFEIEYLQSIRDWPSTPYFSLSDIETRNQTGGMFAYGRLINDVTEHSGELCAKVSAWFRSTFDEWGIDVDTSRQPVYSITLINDTMRSNILDGGAGIAQSLPVIVSAATPAEKPKLCIYEEPETHLHPEAHGEIAEFIATEAVASKGMKFFLIESHSVNFLLRIRTLIANGTLKKDDVALYYVKYDNAKNQSSLQRVTVHEDGSVEGWPENVFKETLSESMALRRAQLEREGGDMI